MRKLSDEWKLQELFSQYNYIKNLHDINGSESDIKRLKIAESKIIENYKIINKKTISPKNLHSIEKKISDLFYDSKFIHSDFGKIPILGPIGDQRINSGLFLDLDDIKEVYLDREDISGSIRTESCGWISWKYKKGDKSMFIHNSLTSKYICLTTMNHFKMETSYSELIKKDLAYYNPDTKMGRNLKRFFISNRFSFHDDLENLLSSLKYYDIYNYK